MIPLIGTSLGYAYCLADRVDEAIALLEETERESAKMQRMGGLAMISVRLGEAYLKKLRETEAQRCGQRALMLSRKYGERGHEAYALRLLAELGANDSPLLEECQKTFLQALRRAEELGLRPLAAQCHHGLGKRYRRIGHQASAEHHLKTAAALFAELGMQVSLDERAPQGHATCGS